MSDVDMSTDLAGVVLPNPVMTAAGCAGTGRELAPFVDPAALGAFVTPSLTVHQSGGTATAVVETVSGWAWEARRPAPPLEGFLARDLPWLLQQGARPVVSVAGRTLGETGELARRVGHSPGVLAVEVNLDVPNEDRGGRAYAQDPYHAAKVVAVARRDVRRGVPVLAKVPADPQLALELAEAVFAAGADGVVVAGSVPGLVLDRTTLRPVVTTPGGRLSGPAVRTHTLRAVFEVHAAMPYIPLVAGGGVATGPDALDLLAAGAVAVQVGTACFHDPAAPARVLQELTEELARRGFSATADVIGRAHRPEGDDG